MSFFSTYAAHYFTVRVRGLTSLVTPIITILCASAFPSSLTPGFQINGFLLDNKRIVLHKKLVLAYGALVTVMAACTVWLMVDCVVLGRHDKPFFDWTTAGWAAYWIPCVFGQAAGWVAYGYK